MSIEEQPFRYAIALTGGIATGKSTVSKRFRKRGFTVIDADKIAHQILDSSAVEVAALFGKEVLIEGGVNRKSLGAIVFSDLEKRRSLEGLLHPRIYKEIFRLSQREEEEKRPYLIDIPLFFETGRYNIPKVIVVYATQQQQIERAMVRDGLSFEKIKQRIEAQLDIEAKCSLADYLIDNSGNTLQLDKEIKYVISKIEKDFL